MNHLSAVSARRLLPATAVAASLGLAGVLATASPAAAVVSIAPNATVTATSGCEGGDFYLHTTMSNPDAGASAHFVLTVDGPATYNGVGIDLAPNVERVDHWKFFDDIPNFVHITSDDHDPAIDFLFAITPNCQPDETVPDETVPMDTVPDETVPLDTIVDSGGGGLPSTGSSDAPMAVAAIALLAAGVGLVRVVRRPA